MIGKLGKRAICPGRVVEQATGRRIVAPIVERAFTVPVRLHKIHAWHGVWLIIDKVAADPCSRHCATIHALGSSPGPSQSTATSGGPGTPDELVYRHHKTGSWQDPPLVSRLA